MTNLWLSPTPCQAKLMKATLTTRVLTLSFYTTLLPPMITEYYVVIGYHSLWPLRVHRKITGVCADVKWRRGRKSNNFVSKVEPLLVLPFKITDTTLSTSSHSSSDRLTKMDCFGHCLV